MRDKHVFVDSNILLYAHDKKAGWKRDRCLAQIAQLWARPYPPAISVQVLQEFFVNLLRFSVPIEEARKAAENFLAWEVIQNTSQLFFEAAYVCERWQLSFWDGMIIAAAKQANAEIVWSEDLQAGQDFDGVMAVNPLTGAS